MRNHAWAIFSGLVQPAIAGDIDGEAVWETWYSKREVDAGCSRLTYHRVRELKLPLEIMAGYMLEDAKPNTPKWAQGLALAKAFFLDVHTPRAQVLYNFSACRHIRTFGLMDSQLLDKQNQFYERIGAPPQERDIPEFPVDSVVVKNVWQVVTPGVNEVDLWKPSPNPGALFRIKVQPANGKPCNMPTSPDSPVLTSCFYNIPVTDQNIEEIRQAAEVGVPPVYEGCVLILVALHVITKEISDWTWTTFWWSVEPDQPPYATGRLGTEFIPSPWRNYVMDTTLSMATPWEKNPLGTSVRGTACQQSANAKKDAPRAKICFNPYLERMLNASSSNCMNCHRQATFHRLDPDPTASAQRGYLGADAACFDDRLKVDYLWSLSPKQEDSTLFKFEKELRNELLDAQRRSKDSR
jgi:hypothetical protein